SLRCAVERAWCAGRSGPPGRSASGGGAHCPRRRACDVCWRTGMRTLLFDVAALWSCIVMLSCGDSAPHDLSDSRSPSEAAGDAASARPSGEYRAEVVRVEGADKQRVYVDL